ncbi:MAG: hypothetical protein J5858_07200, partial [Lentisphaeria bacterium]|nr:hypothetical protein [Lentisphaeria bacterium]
ILKTMFPYPVCNSQDILVCRECGVAGAQAWIELGRRDYDDLMKSSVLPLEAYEYGRPFIFMTRAVLPGGFRKIRDIRGNRFELERKNELTNVYPEEVVGIPLPEGYSGFQDLRKCRAEEENRTDFNFTREWA